MTAGISDLLTFSFSIPKTFFSSSFIFFCLSFLYLKLSACTGLSTFDIKPVADKSSLRIEGAKGLKLSIFYFKIKVFLHFVRSRECNYRSAPQSALGPNSILPWNHPIAFSSDKNSAVLLINSSYFKVSKLAPPAFNSFSISS